MNKKLLTAAIAAGLMAPGLALADVKISGTIQAETGNLELSGASAALDGDNTLMGNNSSGGDSGAINGGGSNAIGVKGTEKLGNGMSVYFNWNNSFGTFNGTNTLGQRDRLVGLKGDGWHAQVGRMNILYKTASHKYDPFIATGFQSRATGGVSGAHNSYGNDLGEVGFKSGNWSGGIQMTWEDSTNDTGRIASGLAPGSALATGNSVDSGSWNGRIQYSGNGFTVGVAHFDMDYGTGAGDADGTKIYAQTTLGGVILQAQHENIDMNVGAATAPRFDGASTMGNASTVLAAVGGTAGQDEHDGWQISATYMMTPSTALIARYADSETDYVAAVAPVDVETTHWAIGVAHFMSKRTHVYAGYTDIEYDTNGFAGAAGTEDFDVDGWGMGLRHKF